MNGSTGKILEADVHIAQQTHHVKRPSQSNKTILVNASPGCKSRVQPLNVVFNKPFKNPFKEQFERHLDENLDGYIDDKVIIFLTEESSQLRGLIMSGKGFVKVKI